MVSEVDYSKAKKDLDNIIDLVVKDHIPIKLIRGKKKSVYIISEEDYDSMEETFYLLKNPENARRLNEAIDSKESVSFSSIEELKNETGI